MDLDFVSDLVGAGIGVAGGLIASSAQNSANAELDEKNRTWQERLWNESNAYNTPLNQRKRLEAAGINPALAFRSGNTGVAASAPTPNQHTPADFSALGSGISQGAQYVLQASQVRANNDLLKSQAEAQRINNLTLYQKNIAEIDRMIAEKVEKGENADYLRWQRERSMALYDAESKKLYHESLEVDARTRQENASAYLMEIDSRLRHLQNVVGIQFSKAQIAHLNADVNRIVEETGYLSERKLYQILDNARMLPDVKKAMRISDRMDANPTETEILDGLGLWLDPVSEAINAGVNVSKARSASRPRARVKRERKYDGKGNSLVTEYDYD